VHRRTGGVVPSADRCRARDARSGRVEPQRVFSADTRRPPVSAGHHRTPQDHLLATFLLVRG
jgi:hypothetical protein